MTELFKQNRLVFMSPTNGPQEGAAKPDNVDAPAKGPDAATSPEQQKKAREIALEVLVKGMKDKKVVINGKEYSGDSVGDADEAYTKYLDAIRKGIEDALVIAMKENPEIDVSELKSQGEIAMNYLITAQKAHETERQNLEKAKAMISSKEHTDSRFTVISIGGGKEYVVANDILEGVKTEFANKIAMFLGLSEDPRRVYYFEGKLTTAGENLMDQILIQMKARSGIEKTVAQEKLESREQYNQKRLADRAERIKRADADPALKAVIDKLPNKITFGPIKVGRSSEQNRLNMEAEISRVADNIANQFNVEGGLGLDEGSLSWISYEVNLLTRQILREKGLYDDLKTGKQVSIDFSAGKKDLYVLAVDYKNKVDQRKVAQKSADVLAPAENQAAPAEDKSAPAESAELVYNKEQFLEAIFKHLEGAVEGYSLIRYEVKGTRSLDAEQRKLSKDEIVAYFAKLGDAVLSQVFDQGMKKMKEGDPKTIDQVVTYGLTWFEYANRDARMAKIPTTAPAGTETAQEGATAQEGKADAVPESTEPTNILEGLKQADKLEQVKALLDQHKRYKRSDWKDINPKLVKIITGKDEAVEEAKGIEMVKDLQQKLIDAGHDVGKDGADGRAGINTLNALKSYLELSEATSVRREKSPAKTRRIEVPEEIKDKLNMAADDIIAKLGGQYSAGEKIFSKLDNPKFPGLGFNTQVQLVKNGSVIGRIFLFEENLGQGGYVDPDSRKIPQISIIDNNGDVVQATPKEGVIATLNERLKSLEDSIVENMVNTEVENNKLEMDEAKRKELYEILENKVKELGSEYAIGLTPVVRKDATIGDIFGAYMMVGLYKNGVKIGSLVVHEEYKDKVSVLDNKNKRPQGVDFAQQVASLNFESESALDSRKTDLDKVKIPQETQHLLREAERVVLDKLGASYSTKDARFFDSKEEKLGFGIKSKLTNNGVEIGYIQLHEKTPEDVVVLDNLGYKVKDGELVEKVASLEVGADKSVDGRKELIEGVKFINDNSDLGLELRNISTGAEDAKGELYKDGKMLGYIQRALDEDAWYLEYKDGMWVNFTKENGYKETLINLIKRAEKIIQIVDAVSVKGVRISRRKENVTFGNDGVTLKLILDPKLYPNTEISLKANLVSEDMTVIKTVKDAQDRSRSSVTTKKLQDLNGFLEECKAEVDEKAESEPLQSGDAVEIE